MRNLSVKADFQKRKSKRTDNKMQKIKYVFADGTESEIEVTDEIYAVHIELANEEKRNNKRETRRHISLTYFDDLGIEFESNAADPLSALIRRDDEERIHNAVNRLSDKQRELAQKVFFEGMTLTAIAKEKGVTQPAITQQLATVLKKLKKLLQKTL